MPAQLIEQCCKVLDNLLKQDRAGILRSQGIAYGVRNLWQLWPEVVDLVKLNIVHQFARQSLGEQFGVVRALLFDKPPERSWNLPWHRDRTIAISPSCIGARSENQLPAGLSNLTIKAGIPHAMAPNWLLERMVTLRFSLDPMTDQNGPLVFLPGSHIVDCKGAETNCKVDLDLTVVAPAAMSTLRCAAGDLFAMRPLLAHSSLMSHPQTRLRRRVVHIELSPRIEEIPWFQFIAV